MSRIVPLKIAQLHVDTENPRLDGQFTSDVDAMQALVDLSPDQLMALVKSIATRGWLMTENLVVTPDGGQKGYTVLEGNRRVTALKVLHNETLATQLLGSPRAKRITKMRDGLPAKIVTVPCLEVPSRAAAGELLIVRHTGQQGGAGVLQWDTEAQARFNKSMGRANPALDLLNYVRANGKFSNSVAEKLRDISLTNFERLVNDIDVRAAIGIAIGKDGVKATLPATEVMKPLTRFVKDLAEGMEVAKIYNKGARKAYLNGLPAPDLPNPKAKPVAAYSLTAATAGSASTSASNTKKSTASAGTKDRKTLVPKPGAIVIPTGRENDIYLELRKLNVADATNATAVLFRVFVELSIEHYCCQLNIPLTRKPSKPGAKDYELKLREKLVEAKKYMTANNVRTAKELGGTDIVLSKDSALGLNVSTLNQFVHSKYTYPSPQELKIAWDNLSVFLNACWEPKTS